MFAMKDVQSSMVLSPVNCRSTLSGCGVQESTSGAATLARSAFQIASFSHLARGRVFRGEYQPTLELIAETMKGMQIPESLFKHLKLA
jgi:hypothetical protein